MRRDATTASARVMVDEWVRAGVTDACVAPGSRSAPLALALAQDDRVRVHVHHDERSGSFFALGIGKASGRPAVMVCTSGTAAANLHPAVLEAHHARVPLVVCSADRPPELRDTGAGQTIDQARLFGSALRWSCDPGPPTDADDLGVYWRSVAARSATEALGPPAGPVHLNLAYREPLVPSGEPLVDVPERSSGRPWVAVTRGRRLPDEATVTRLAEAVRTAPRGLVVAGWGASASPAVVQRFAEAAGWPVLADPLSGLRTGSHAVSTYDALARVGDFCATHRPDLVVRVGGPVTSKAVTHWLGPDVPQLLVDPDGAWLDPRRAAAEVLTVEPEELLGALSGALDEPREPSAWLESWLGAERLARRAIDGVHDDADDVFAGRVARDLVAALPGGATLGVASSMPVRDVESFAAPRDALRILSNRGVNGIDGFVSTVLGVAAAGSEPVAALTGDLCFLHDSNGLLGATERDLDAVFVVVDNDGGGIFSFLPQADAPGHFEEIFATPHGIDLAALAAVHRVPCTVIERASSLASEVTAALDAGGVRIVLVRTERTDNVERHRRAWAAVAAAIHT